MALTIQNSFGKLKEEFKNDTGLSADNNMNEYLLYFNARRTDESTQILAYLTTQLINKLEHLPDLIALRIAESKR